MSSIWETQHGLWTEQLKILLSGKHVLNELTGEQTRRLIIATYVALQEHRVNKRGQCHLCRRSRPGWLPRRRRTCTVYMVFMIAMTQPMKLVWDWLHDY